MTVIRRCPSCRADQSASTGTRPGSEPYPGALSVCMYCQAACRFGPLPDMPLAQLTTEEIDALPPEAKVALMQAAAVSAKFVNFNATMRHSHQPPNFHPGTFTGRTSHGR